MRIVYHVMAAPAPLGLLLLASSEHGLRHVHYMDRRSLKRTIAQFAPASPAATWEPSVLEMRTLAEQFDQYFTGARRRVDAALDPAGSELELATWRALLDVPYGETRTIADLAKAIGQPRALRPVALAVQKNPLALVVPCHRVVGADGKPTAYVGGLPRKKYLLGLEQRFRRLGGLDDNRVIGELLRVVKRAKPAARKKSATARRPAASRRTTTPARRSSTMAASAPRARRTT